jgi:hypothetical protein
MRRSHLIAIVTGISTATVVTSPSYAQQQPYGITISTSIATDLPTTSSGGGGQYSNSPPEIQTTLNSYAIAPYGHADAVVATDPTNGGLYRVSAKAEMYVSSVEAGRLSISSEAATNSVDANVYGTTNSDSNVVWSDYLLIGGLQKGTAVTLEVTALINGSLIFSGAATDSSSLVQFQTIIINADGSGEGSLVNFETSAPFSSKKTYLVHTYSGATLNLFEELQAYLGGALQYSGTADVNGAHMTVRSLTPAVTIFTVSGNNYEPEAQVLAPTTTGRSLSDAQAAIVASGLVVGKVSTAPSGTVKSGAVVRQIPAPEVEVDDGSTVDIVVSSGPKCPAAFPAIEQQSHTRQ